MHKGRCDGRPSQKVRQMDIDVFWNEFESIEPTIQETQDEEDEPLNELEQDVEWLKEAGFKDAVNRYRDSKEINVDDAAINTIASSLTRKQADAVKRRINKLNQNVKERLSLQETSSGPIRPQPPDNNPSRHRNQYTDIRSIFPIQTVGEPSNYKGLDERPARRSYSEGVPVVRSQGPPAIRSTRSQENINRIQPAPSAVKIVTTNANTPTKLSRPTVFLPAGSRTPSPKAKRESAAYAAQLTGITQGHSPTTSKPAGKVPSKKLGGSMFYITAVSNNNMSTTSPKSQGLQDLSINDNWEITERSPSVPEQKSVTPTTEETFLPSNHDEIDEEIFKEVSVANEKPAIGIPKNKSDGATTPKFPHLPNFTLTRDVYGVTRIEDLSLADMEKVRSLALIELTALFDSNNVVFNRRKPTKRKTKENGVFGVPLLNLIHHDRGDNAKYNTPVILEEMIAFLKANGINEEGILRVPGSAARIRTMREEIEEKYQDRLFIWTGRKPHDVAALLKQFLRELPFPLLTYEYQPTFASVEEISNRVQQLQALNLLVLLLPLGHRETLRLLLGFLCLVISRKKENKMDLNNVAMIMAPNLFLNTGGNKSRATLREVEMAKGTINIVRMLIKYHAILWTVPSFMIRQVRFLYEVELSGKTKENKNKKRKAKKTVSDQASHEVVSLKKSLSVEDLDRIEQEFENHIIRVKAPTLEKIGMAVQLTKETKARDIVEKFCKASKKYKEIPKRNSSSQVGHSHKGNKCPCGENHFLYEIGGNIGERCLDFETNMLQLSRLNPHAEWMIKIKN